MESSNGVSNLSIFSHTNNTQMFHPPISPLLCISPSPSDNNHNNDTQQGHHRCSSESVVIEEQPSWLDDLLNEPETEQVQPKTHRRSASDPCALYLDASDTRPQHKQFQNTTVFNPWMSPQYVVRDLEYGNASRRQPSIFCSDVLLNSSLSSIRDQTMSAVMDTNGEGELCERRDQLQMKPYASKAEAKRAKQQTAHRSRVRKLQYIAELERHIQLFQAEGLKLFGESEFLDQQNLILGMENRTLRQRLESISQELLVRNLEHDVLERELARLQMLYQVQQQQQQQQLQQRQQQSHQQYPKHRRSKSRDSGNKSLKNKEAAGPNHLSFGDLESHLASLSLWPNEASF